MSVPYVNSVLLRGLNANSNNLATQISRRAFYFCASACPELLFRLLCLFPFVKDVGFKAFVTSQVIKIVYDTCKLKHIITFTPWVEKNINILWYFEHFRLSTHISSDVREYFHFPYTNCCTASDLYIDGNYCTFMLVCTDVPHLTISCKGRNACHGQTHQISLLHHVGRWTWKGYYGLLISLFETVIKLFSLWEQ